MKRISLAAVLSLSLFLSSPKPAEAGILFATIGGAGLAVQCGSGRADACATGVAIGVPTLLLGIGVAITGIGNLAEAPVMGWMMITLDAAPDAVNSLEYALARRYPEIEDAAVLRALAAEIEAGIPDSAEIGGGFRYLALREERARALLAPTGLAESRPGALDRIVTDLR